MDLSLLERVLKVYYPPCRYTKHSQNRPVKCLGDQIVEDLYAYANYLGLCPRLVKRLMKRAQVQKKYIRARDLTDILKEPNKLREVVSGSNVTALFQYTTVDGKVTSKELVIQYLPLDHIIKREIELCRNTPPREPPQEVAELMKKMLTVPKAKIDLSRTPPCIQRLLEKAQTERYLSHPERVALATFLICREVLRGSSPEQAVEKAKEPFKLLEDYNEKITEYQLKHLAGLAGGRKFYLPPTCEKLKEWGICTEECGFKYMSALSGECKKHVSD